MDAWEPISQAELESLIREQLAECDSELIEVLQKHRVTPFRAPIERLGQEEQVFVVARRGSEVMYYEDVEGGFNFSPISPEGRILERWCNQDELNYALLRWK